MEGEPGGSHHLGEYMNKQLVGVRRRRDRMAIATVSLGVMLGGVAAAPAYADDLASDVKQVTDTSPVAERFDDLSAQKAAVDGNTVSVGDGATELTVELPVAESADSSTGEDLISLSDDESYSIVPAVLDDGSVAIHSVLNDSTAPATFDYTIDLPAGSTLEPMAGGGAIAYNVDGSPAVFVSAPWATDANGDAVETHYTMQGSTITQHVRVTEDSAFPVVADPWLGVDLISKWKWWTYKGKPAISVSVTPMMAAIGTSEADWAGWDELLNKVTKSKKSDGTELRKPTYRQQWTCHAAGKALIGIGGWLGVDKKPTWDLESSRGTTNNPVKAVTSKCSW